MWQRFFQDTELLRIIKLDLIRTHPEIEYFQSAEAQLIMQRVLFVWCKLNPEISYRQGMNELVAPILYTLNPSTTLEADVYALFDALMQRTGCYFEALDSRKQAQVRKLGIAELEQKNSVVVLSETIQNTMLKRYDPKLYTHLRSMDIEPQVYGIRWLRVLFTREFEFNDVFVLWDAIFDRATPHELPFLSFIVLAMLSIVRKELLSSDSSGCLTILLKYPRTVTVPSILSKAEDIENKWESNPSPKSSHSTSSESKVLEQLPETVEPIQTHEVPKVVENTDPLLGASVSSSSNKYVDIPRLPTLNITPISDVFSRMNLFSTSPDSDSVPDARTELAYLTKVVRVAGDDLNTIVSTLSHLLTDE